MRKAIDKANDYLMRWGNPDAACSIGDAIEIIETLKDEYIELEEQFATERESERAEIEKCNAEIGEMQGTIQELDRNLDDLAGENIRLQNKNVKLEYALDLERDRAPAPEPKTLRDKFAMAALTGLVGRPEVNDEELGVAMDDLVADAFRYADFCMEARKK